MCSILDIFKPYFPTLETTMLSSFYKRDIVNELKIYYRDHSTCKVILIKVTDIRSDEKLSE